MSSDERLVKRAARGDARAIEQIYERYHQDIYRFCLSMLGNPQDAQDVLQNTMVKVLRALPGEKREIKLKPWLYRIARNESVEALRRRRGEGVLEPEQGATVAGPAEAAETRSRLRQLFEDLDQLPQRQRSVLAMRELSGLSFAEIAASFDTSEAVARQTLYEARLSLRQIEEGREMRCAAVQKELSDADGRITRRRRIRAHLRDCSDCRDFQREIARRRQDLAALAPLPAASAASLLHSLLGGNLTGVVSGVGGGASAAAGAGKAIATSAVIKSVTAVAVVAAIGVGADRSGLVHLPTPGGGAAAAEGSGGDGEGDGARVSAGAGPEGGGSADAAETGGGGGAAPDPAANRGHGARTAAPTTPTTTASEAGKKPPGGGFGRDSSERKGPPEELPSAADRGRQTAAEKAPPEPDRPPAADRGLPPRAGSAPGPPDSIPPPAAGDAADPPGAPPGPQGKGPPPGTPPGG